MTRVRPARRSDAAAVREAHVAAIEAFGPDAYDEEEVAAWAERDQDEPEFEGFDDPDTYWVVATRRGDVAGFGRLDLAESEVIAVYVHPGHAREGVGSAVLAHLEGYARGAGLESLGLTASLNAVEFYERAGYERRRDVSFETSTGVEIDCVELSKEL